MRLYTFEVRTTDGDEGEYQNVNTSITQAMIQIIKSCEENHYCNEHGGNYLEVESITLIKEELVK